MQNETENVLAQERPQGPEGDIANVLIATIRLVQSLSDDQPALLWAESVGGPLLSALHDAAANMVSPSVEHFDYSVGADSVRVQVARTSDLTLLLGAVQLVSGVSEGALLDACVGGAFEQLDLILQEHVEDEHPERIGARRGDVDWSGASLELVWIDAAADGNSCECEAIITVDGTLSFPIVVGTTGVEKPRVFATTECRVEGSMLVTLSVEDGRVAEVAVDDDQIETFTV